MTGLSPSQPPATFGVPGLRHFWDPLTSASANIKTIRDRGPGYSQEDVVWHAWHAICLLYFPETTNDPTGPIWSTVREAYRGPSGAPSTYRPDILTIKMMLAGQTGALLKRDVLWIECKAPDKDAPFEWKDVIRETVERLESAHPNRELFVVLAIGLKWMYFAWDPQNAVGRTPQLFMRRHSGRGAPWIIDPRIKAFHDAPWVDTRTGEVRPSNAMSLDFWSTTRVGRESRVSNWQGLELLEQFLHVVRSSTLTGVNPAHF